MIAGQSSRLLGSIVFGFLAVGCFDNVVTPFEPGLDAGTDSGIDPGLQPLEENTAVFPEPENGLLPERLSSVEPEFAAYVKIHGRGYIHAPLNSVLRALRDPQVMRDPAVGTYRIHAYDTDPTYAYSYEAAFRRTADLGVTVEWRVGHRVESVIVDGVSEIRVRWQKVWGTTAITRLAGSMVFRSNAEDSEITEVELIYHTGAIRDPRSEARGTVTSLYERIRNAARGEPVEPRDCEGCAEAPARYLE